jgi:hypothetical protein
MAIKSPSKLYQAFWTSVYPKYSQEKFQQSFGQAYSLEEIQTEWTSFLASKLKEGQISEKLAKKCSKF